MSAVQPPCTVCGNLYTKLRSEVRRQEARSRRGLSTSADYIKEIKAEMAECRAAGHQRGANITAHAIEQSRLSRADGAA